MPKRPRNEAGMSTTHSTRKAARTATKKTDERRSHATATQAADDVAAHREQRHERLKKHKRPLIIVGLIIVIAAMLYAPARTYYSAWRTNSILQNSYSDIGQQNSDLQDELTSLQTREGIEDEARKRGYVAEGETGVKVDGLDESSSSNDVATSSDPWYVSVLDFIFAYQEGSA